LVLMRFIAGLLLLAVCCLLLSAPAPLRVARAQTGGWDIPQNISNTPSKSWLPDIAVDSSGQLHVVWTEYPDNKEAGQWGDAIFYTMWDGVSWSHPSDILVIQNGFSHLPAIAVDSRGLLHVTWTDTVNIYHSQAWVQGSPWSAASWSSPVVISGGGRTYFSDIAVDSRDNIHVVWVESSLDDNLIEGVLCRFCDEIYYARSQDGGSTWSAPINISNTIERDNRPRLLVDIYDHLHVVWDRVDSNDSRGLALGYVRSIDGGTSWSEPLNLNADVGVEQPTNPTLAVDSQGRVHAMWFGRLEGRSVIFHRWSEDNGLSWMAGEVLPFHLIDYSGYGVQQVFDPGDHLHIVFSAREDSSIHNVYYASWDGNAWSLPVNISGSQQRSVVGRIGLRLGNEIHIVWYEHPLGVDPLVKTNVQMEVFHNCVHLSRPSLAPVPLPAMPAPTSTPTPVHSATLVPIATTQATQTTDLSSSELPVGSGDVPVLVIPILAVTGILGLVILIRIVTLGRPGSR